jgi:uncharacterized protein
VQSDDRQRFLDLVLRNRANGVLLARLRQLDLPDCHLVAGCLSQTVWNCLSGMRPDTEVVDYDVFYYDASDPSWEAEDAAIRRARALFGDLGVDVQVRNQARVHLWYERKFGLACPPLRSVRDGIDHFLNRSSCFGIRPSRGALDVYAPFGYEDLYSMTVRPNRRRELPEIYYAKARRWRAAWPALNVIPWPTTSAGSADVDARGD